MKMTNNIENDDKGDSGGAISNKLTTSNPAQLNSSLIKILSSNNSSNPPVSMIKSSSMASVTSVVTTSSLTSTLATSQIINNSESEIITKNNSNSNQIENFSITNSIGKATQNQYNKSPKHSIRSNSSHSLNEYYSSSPIPTPKARSITNSTTTPLPSYSFTTNIKSSNTNNDLEEYLNEYSYFYSEEELNTYKNVTNFICKIAQLILRSRVGLSYNHNYYPQSQMIKKNMNNNIINSAVDRNSQPLNSLTNSFSNMNLKASYASSISSTESQAQSIPYSLSINSSYTSSFENSYSNNPNGIFSSYARNNTINIPTPSIDNIKQLHGLLIDRLPFWKNRIPINIDIFAGNSSCNTINKINNEDYKRRSNEYTIGNEIDKEYESNRSSTTRIRSSSKSNIYPISNSIPSNTSSTKFNNKRLLERWVVSYEPTTDHDSINKGKNSKIDTTDFILLVQSLYSYIRLMPLHSLITDNSVKKTDLQYCISTADGYLLLPVMEEQNNMEFCDIGSSGFDLSAKLKVYKFTKASTNLGNLLISVVYDANINNTNSSSYTSNISHSISKPISSSASLYNNDSNYYPKVMNAANQSNPNNYSSTTSSSTIISPKKDMSKDNMTSSDLLNESSSFKNKENSEKDEMDKKSDTPTDDEASSPDNRRKSSSIGSPFPSPKTHTKVLSLTQAKYGQSASYSSSTPNLLHKLMNKQRLEKYSSSVHSLSDNNSLSSNSNLLLSGFNYKKSGSNDLSTNDYNKRNNHPPINIPNNIIPPLDYKNNQNAKIGNQHLSLSYNSNKSSNEYQSNSMELFGSLVGSYEESILSGRMSTLPSKPIKFISEIGVIGFGKCHPRLKCPPHINITFPVYFYEIPDKNDFFTTPYVGTVDIEQYLQKQNLLKQQKQQQLQQQQQQQQKLSSTASPIEDKLSETLKVDPTTTNSTLEELANQKRESEGLNGKIIKNNNGNIPSVILLNDEPMLPRTSSSSSLNGLSSKFPGYRIPFKGQIQVIIKNPSKTAVKVFLIPYDFHDMPPNTKTFIRQKSYLKNIKSNIKSHDQKYSLRYAIHLQFISPSKKRLYLCKTMRVVFAHKAPEKDEKLYTISEGPVDPKYIPLVEPQEDSHTTNGDHEKNFNRNELPLKSENHGLSVKDDNNYFPSSYSYRRRSSFGSNMMMLAEMGVNLGDYSVSPVKPIIHQHRRSLSNGSNSSLIGSSNPSMNSLGQESKIATTTSKVMNPLYYNGGNLTMSGSGNGCRNRSSSHHPRGNVEDHRYLEGQDHHEPLSSMPPSSYNPMHLSLSQHLPPPPYAMKPIQLSKNPNKSQNSSSYDLTSTSLTTSYSSGGLTKMVNDHPTDQPYYLKSTKKSSPSSNTSDVSNLHSSIDLLSETNLKNPTLENSSSSPDFKVFNYIN